VANDDEFQLFCAEQILQIMQVPPCNFLLVADGQSAWDAFQKNPEFFSLILLDLNMPKLDGFQVARKIRQRQSQAKVDEGGQLHPIVVSVSSNILSADMLT
jgi:CheY-like chemotaxis protein